MDVDHENGGYHNTCVYCNRGFIGHKRRVVCRVCDASPPMLVDLSGEITVQPTNADLTNLYNDSNQMHLTRNQSITTERIFVAMRAAMNLGAKIGRALSEPSDEVWALLKKLPSKEFKAEAISLSLDEITRHLRSDLSVEHWNAIFTEPSPEKRREIWNSTENYRIEKVRLLVEQGGAPAVAVGASPEKSDGQRLFEAIAKRCLAAEEELYQLRVRVSRLTTYTMCLSYDSSYFGEPAGFLKRELKNIERTLPVGWEKLPPTLQVESEPTIASSEAPIRYSFRAE